MGDIADAVAYQNRMRTEKLEPLYAAREALAQTGLAARNVLAIGNHEKAAQELGKMDLDRRTYLAQLEKMRPAFAGVPEFDKVSAGLLKMAAELDRVRVLSGHATTGPLAAFIADECRPLRNQIVADMDRLLTMVQADVDHASDAAQGKFRQATLLMWGAGGLALLVAAIVGVLITRSITVPLAKAVALAETVAAGDLTGHIDSRAQDEVGQLLRALGRMNGNLLNIIGEVRSGTNVVTEASGNIACGNRELAARTERQTASLQETAAFLEQLTTTVRQNADDANEAGRIAASASDVARQGGEVIVRVNQTMERIRESAGRIGDIIGTIDGIAFQTNILALNASVEAARAGEQGRGFAVVASEVRSLAQRSSAAAREIRSLIADSIDKVQDGSALVQEAGVTMAEIVERVHGVSAIMENTMTAIREQRSGIERVNDAVGQIDQVTRQNALLVDEAASTADTLQRQAGGLAQSVSIFRLSERAIENKLSGQAPLPRLPSAS